MKIVIESTDQIIETPELHARVWSGLTEQGNTVELFVSRIAAFTDAAILELDKELIEPTAFCPLSKAIAELMLHWRRVPAPIRSVSSGLIVANLEQLTAMVANLFPPVEESTGDDTQPDNSEFPF